jgi:hypothetical protein
MIQDLIHALAFYQVFSAAGFPCLDEYRRIERLLYNITLP